VSTSGSILIVDDEFGLAEMLRDMLRDYGYDVSVAINGRLALDILKERPIGLVITDMMMPVMDGAELASAMRESETYRHIPIVMMTSLPSAMPHQSTLFHTVIRKPFTPELLLRTVRACFAEQPHGNGGPPVVDRSPSAGEPTKSQTVSTDHRSLPRRSEQ
jgi:DNA-binding response OmpR family regulator